jgi:ABC-type glycerol-3-phosphate transport system substrate-binding protein
MRTKLTVAALALFGVVLAGAPAFAQNAKVTIPFAFTVMGKTLPAGVYEFSEQAPDLIKLESVNSPALQVELMVVERLESDGAPRDARVVFDRHHSKDVLTQVWLDGDDGFVVSLPKR